MKIEFTLSEKAFIGKDGNEVKCFVLSKKLVDGSVVEVFIKSDKAKLLNLNYHLENK